MKKTVILPVNPTPIVTSFSYYAFLESIISTSDQKGTDMEDVKPGLDRYFKEIGIQDAITHYYGFDGYRDAANWIEMKRRIDFGEPFIYGVSDHYWYTEHAVLAVG